MNREHGSSYLAITEWVGVVGILPFAVLIFLVMQAIARVCFFSASHWAGFPLLGSPDDGDDGGARARCL